MKRLAGSCLFHLCKRCPAAKSVLGNLGLRTRKEWFANHTASTQLPGGQSLQLASIGENYLSFQLFWRGTQYYEPITTLVLKELVQPGDTFLDVGANIGFYSLVVATTQPKVRVIAFEPNPKVHALLRKNVQANNLQQITCENAAMSDTVGTATLYLSRSDHSASLKADFEESSTGSIAVPLLTLDAYLTTLKRTPATRLVIKIDVEGNEDAVLHGARETLLSVKPDIVIETAQNRQDGPLAFLNEMGYRLYSITDHGLEETSKWAPVVREPFVFLNHLLTARPRTEITDLFNRIKTQVKAIDLHKTSKLADPTVLRRSVKDAGMGGQLSATNLPDC